MPEDKKALLAKIRQRLTEQTGKKKFEADPFEFRPPKVEPGESKSYQFIILPPLEVGDAVMGEGKPGAGKSTTDMRGLYFIQTGRHWVDSRPYECPRQHSNDDCPLCTLGFELLRDTEDRRERSEIAKKYLSRSTQVVNAYFLPYKSNPEELRGKVMWIQISQKAIQKRFEECINLDEDDAFSEIEDLRKAYGFFYMPDESYVFNMVVKHENGFNNYDESNFLPSTRGPIIKDADGKLDKRELAKLLVQRHDLASKFESPNVEELQKLVDKIVNPDSDSGGFDESENQPVRSQKAAKPAVVESKRDPDLELADMKTEVTTVDDTGSDDDPDLEDLIKELSQNVE